MAGALLFLLAILSFWAGFSTFRDAYSAVHEIAALVLFLTGAVFTVGTFIVDRLGAIQRLLKELLPTPGAATTETIDNKS